MAQIVKLRRSSVSGQKPTNDNLQLGELAVNTTDGKVFLAKSGSLGPTIEEIVTTNTINTGSINLIGGITVSGDVSGSNIKASSFIKSGGKNTEYLMADGGVSTLTNPITGSGNPNYIPKFSGSGTIGNSQIFDNGTGVGIGTTSPSVKLQIQDTTPILRIQSNAVNNDSALQLMETSILGAEIRYNGSSTNNLQFNINDGTGFITKMQLNRDSGILNVPASITIGQNPQTFSKLSIKLDGDGQGILIDRGINSGTNSWNGLFFKFSNGNSQPKSAIVHERLGSNGVGTLHFLTTNDETSTIGVNLSNARMSITKDGNVGIGTPTPNSKLDVNGNTTLSGSLMVSQSLIQYSSVTSVPSGSVTDVMSFNTGSYTAAFFDFVITSGSNSRAGTIFTNWNGNNIEYTETSTNDIGDTTAIQLSTSLTSGLLKLQATSIMGSWSVKTLARMI